jgi:hypothetical protein
MRRHACFLMIGIGLTTALVASASAGRRDTTITLDVSTSVIPLHERVSVYGTISNGNAYASVTVQFRECGLRPAVFRDATEVPAPPDGPWYASIEPQANGTLRAILGPAVSNEVRVLARANVVLVPAMRGRYRAEVEARLSFWRKRVRIERYDRGRSRWLVLRTISLDHADGGTSGGITYVRSKSDEFILKVPAGTKLRAVFPLSQAKPCYAAGTSEIVRA